MRDSGSRLLLAFALILGVWVATYWLYEPQSSAGSRPPGDAAPASPSSPYTPPPKITLDPPQPEFATAPPTQPAPTPPAPPAPVDHTPKLQSPQFREYVVQKGDSGWKQIAARPEVYGRADHWQAVARANPFVSPDRLKPGKTVLKIPLDPDNIQGRLVTVDGEGSVKPVEPAATTNSASATPRTYTVTSSDSLWSISKKVYGKGSLWKQIYEANRALIKDPDKPPAGAVLTIPESP